MCMCAFVWSKMHFLLQHNGGAYSQLVKLEGYMN